MTRQHAGHAPAHVHLTDATHHLANARRSQAAAARAPVELRIAVLAAERHTRRLGIDPADGDPGVYTYGSQREAEAIFDALDREQT